MKSVERPFHFLTFIGRTRISQTGVMLLICVFLGSLAACSGPSKEPESGKGAPSTVSGLGNTVVSPAMEKINSTAPTPPVSVMASNISLPPHINEEKTPPQSKQQDSKQVVAAIVNGEAIYEKELDEAMSDDLFEEALKSAKAEKLESLIAVAAMRQFLKKQGIEVSEQEVDADIAKQRANPPSAGCPCCRYQSLEQYMQINHVTMAELRNMSRNELGFQKYLEILWKRDYPTHQDLTHLLNSRRTEFSAQYAKAYHIFFNTVQDPRYAQNPEAVTKKKQEVANKAWQRLQKGEKFAAVAKSMSEDAMSAKESGELGCVQKDMFGKEFDRALFSLKIGAYSKPVESQWGVHVIKRGEIREQDILAVLKGEFKDAKADETLHKVQKEAKIERLGEWAKMIQ